MLFFLACSAAFVNCLKNINSMSSCIHEPFSQYIVIAILFVYNILFYISSKGICNCSLEVSYWPHLRLGRLLRLSYIYKISPLWSKFCITKQAIFEYHPNNLGKKNHSKIRLKIGYLLIAFTTNTSTLRCVLIPIQMRPVITIPSMGPLPPTVL